MNEERFRRRRLPHWDMPGAPYFVTTCLEGSIPALSLKELRRYREELLQHPMPDGLTLDRWKSLCWKKSFVRLENWLDGEPGRHDLADFELAQIVENAIFHFAGERYDLFAYVVMPSHFHWLFRPRESWTQGLPPGARSPREQITYSINRFTATACNHRSNTRGPFWQTESYDHWVRDLDEFERVVAYIEDNPVKAGLVRDPTDWRFSSAWHRGKTSADRGIPLRKSVGQDSNPVR